MNALLRVSKNRLSSGKSRLFVRKNLFVLLLSLAFMCLTTKAYTAPDGKTNELLQFTAGEHVIAFTPECLYLTGSDHMLKVTFQNANVTTPRRWNTIKPWTVVHSPLKKLFTTSFGMV